MRAWIVVLPLLAACGEKDAQRPAGSAAVLVLEAARVPEGTHVRIDAQIVDPVWEKAPILTVPLTGDGPAEVVLKAAYDAERIYLLAHWPDEEISLNRFWRYVDLATWERHTGEDAFSICWSPGALASTFRERGCAMFCHGDRHVYPELPAPGKDYADFWFWGAQTTFQFGQARDMWLPFGKDQRLRGDRQPGDADNQLNLSHEYDGPACVPAYIRPDSRRVLTPGNMQPLPLEKLKAKISVERNRGWEVPLDVLRAMKGSRGDVRAVGNHAGKRWVLEMARALNTGNTDDQPLGDVLVSQLLAVAIHDGTDGKAHSISGPIELRLLPIR